MLQSCVWWSLAPRGCAGGLRSCVGRVRIIPELVVELENLLPEPYDNPSPCPLEFSVLQEQVQHLSEDQRIGADSKDMEPMANEEHDEFPRSCFKRQRSGFSYRRRPCSVYGHQDYRCLSLLSPHEPLVSLHVPTRPPALHACTCSPTLTRCGAHTRQRAKDVWVAQRNIILEAIQCRRFFGNNETGSVTVKIWLD